MIGFFGGVEMRVNFFLEGRDAGVGSCVRGAVGVDNAKLRPGGGGFGAIMRGGVKFFQKNPLASG